MEQEEITPRQMGVRVRAHPGRLAIVSRNKMHHADIVQVSYSGQRLQTFIFDETNSQVIDANRKAAANFVAECGEVSPERQSLSSPALVLRQYPCGAGDVSHRFLPVPS